MENYFNVLIFILNHYVNRILDHFMKILYHFMKIMVFKLVFILFCHFICILSRGKFCLMSVMLLVIVIRLGFDIAINLFICVYAFILIFSIYLLGRNASNLREMLKARYDR